MSRRTFRKYKIRDKNGQDWFIEGGFVTIISNVLENTKWKIQQQPFVMVSPEKRYKDGGVMRYATYHADNDEYRDKCKEEIAYIKNFSPVIFCNDLTGENWDYDHKLPTGRFLENISVSTNAKGETTIYVFIDALIMED